MTEAAKIPPPNPLYKREYVASCDHGHVTISIPAPGGELPYGEDAEEIICFMQLIIGQLNRSIKLHAEAPKEPNHGAIAVGEGLPEDDVSKLPPHVREERCWRCGEQATKKYVEPGTDSINGMRVHPKTWYLCDRHYTEAVACEPPPPPAT